MTCEEFQAMRGKGNQSRATIAAMIRHTMGCRSCLRFCDSLLATRSALQILGYAIQAAQDLAAIMADPEALAVTQERKTDA
jgi:hypothetical protein